MKIYTLFILFAVVCLLISCSTDDGFAPSQKKVFNPELDHSLYSKDADTLPGDPIPPKGKG